MKKYIPHIIIIVLLLVLCGVFVKSCKREKALTNAYKNANSELVKWKNKHGEEVAKIKNIETLRRGDFLKMQTQDSTIIALQKLVKSQKPEVAIIYETITKIDTFTKIEKDGIFNFKDKWIDLSGFATDSLIFNLSVKNDYNIIQKKDYTEIVNLNPYTSTENLRVYKEPQKRKKFTVGVGIGLCGGFDLISRKPAVCIGGSVGFYYTLF